MYPNDMYQFYISTMDCVHQYVFAIDIQFGLNKNLLEYSTKFIVAKTNGVANLCKVLYLYKH